MSIATVSVVLGVVLAFAWAVRSGGTLPSPYRLRECQGKTWRRAFPDASKTEVRRFLSVFTESFAFSDAEKLKFNPNDQLLDVYRALYPYKWQADAMELETLSEEIQAKYGVEFSHVWRRDMTLGQLFSCVRLPAT
jgi:propanediol dehydratase small subunit